MNQTCLARGRNVPRELLKPSPKQGWARRRGDTKMSPLKLWWSKHRGRKHTRETPGIVRGLDVERDMGMSENVGLIFPMK